MVAACLTLALLTAAPVKADTAVICPPEFREALSPWTALRESEGRRIVWIETSGSAAQIRERIVHAAKDHELRWVLIVGDVASPFEPVAPGAARVPTHFVTAKVNIHWGSTPEIATDNHYGDLDGDGIPELAVGRLTADTPEGLSVMVGKILAYEQSHDPGEWRRRVHFVAGVGGFGRVTDALLEASARSLVGAGIPAGFDTTMTFASWDSPYCPSPARFQSATIDRLNDGSLFWVYIGHGHPRALDVVKAGNRAHPIFQNGDVNNLTAEKGAPVALFFACYTGAFDADRDCLCEEMLAAPGGPVAAIAASRVAMPYSMSVLGSEWMRACFSDQAQTLGEIFLQGKQRSLTAAETQEGKTLESIARLLTPGDDSLDDERLEHLSLFNLLGDPLLRIRLPEKVDVRVTAEAGRTLNVEGFSPVSGTVEVDVAVARGRLAAPIAARRTFDPSQEAQDRYDRDYARANDVRLVTERFETRAGKFTARLKVPESARGDCQVRAFVKGKKSVALGACDVQFREDEAEWAVVPVRDVIARGPSANAK